MRKRVQEFVVHNLDTVDELTVKGSGWLDQGSVNEVLELLSELEKDGSPILKSDMHYLIKGLEEGFLLDGLGISVD